MRELQVHSLPLKKVIADIAKAFNTSFTQECDEFSLKIPEEWGTGSIKGINFDGGIGLLNYSCTFRTDIEMSFTIDEIHPLKFLYCLEGSLIHHFENDDQRHELNRFQNIVIASKGHNGHVLRFQKDIATEIYSLEIDRQKFNLKVGCELDKAKPSLKKIFKDEMANKSFYYNGLYSLDLAEIFDEIKTKNYDHLIRNLFLESQSYRMLTQQILQIDDDLGGHKENRILRKAEVDAIKEAVDIIKVELDALGSISSIAQRVGLSPKKIQSGFNHFYGKSVNEFIQLERLSLARSLLLNTDDTIQEIKNKVGFSSHSYFTELFKGKYQVTPTNYRKDFKINKGSNNKLE